jgi:hypothetical protein
MVALSGSDGRHLSAPTLEAGSGLSGAETNAEVIGSVVMLEGACHDLAGANGARDLVTQDTAISFDGDCNLMISQSFLAHLSPPVMTHDQFRVLLQMSSLE